jgi:hypothetical protein
MPRAARIRPSNSLVTESSWRAIFHVPFAEERDMIQRVFPPPRISPEVC